MAYIYKGLNAVLNISCATWVGTLKQRHFCRLNLAKTKLKTKKKKKPKLVPVRQFVDPRDNYRSHVLELPAQSLRIRSLLTSLRGALRHFWPVK